MRTEIETWETEGKVYKILSETVGSDNSQHLRYKGIGILIEGEWTYQRVQGWDVQPTREQVETALGDIKNAD